MTSEDSNAVIEFESNGIIGKLFVPTFGWFRLALLSDNIFSSFQASIPVCRSPNQADKDTISKFCVVCMQSIGKQKNGTGSTFR